MKKLDYHFHSHFSADSEELPRKHVTEAKAHGLEEIWRGEGISILRKENLAKNFTEFSICARCNEWAYNDFTQEDTPQAKEKVLYIE